MHQKESRVKFIDRLISHHLKMIHDFPSIQGNRTRKAELEKLKSERDALVELMESFANNPEQSNP